MSIRCNLEIEIKDIPGEHRKELLGKLLQYRPEDSAIIICNSITEYPSIYNDDVSECIIDFMEKHKITTKVTVTLDEEVFEMYFLDGILEEDEDE